ncbi:hypothetical protein GGI05_000245 [Coemansia sp. RSA 2603]|nr:hypothetical protein GGI05_000245 [Coemansia sp. RSA 2603]
MTKYGHVLDIVLYKKGTFLSDSTQVVIEMAEDQTVKDVIHTDEYIVHAVGKRVTKGCTYCKKEGHVRADCPARPQSKRERQQQNEKQHQQSSPDDPQNEAWAKCKKVAFQPALQTTTNNPPLGQSLSNSTPCPITSNMLTAATRPSTTQPATPTKPHMQTRAQASANKQATPTALTPGKFTATVHPHMAITATPPLAPTCPPPARWPF